MGRNLPKIRWKPETAYAHALQGVHLKQAKGNEEMRQTQVVHWTVKVLDI